MGYGIIAEELTVSSLLQIRCTNEIQLILKCTFWSPCFTSFAYYLFSKLKLYVKQFHDDRNLETLRAVRVL